MIAVSTRFSPRDASGFLIAGSGHVFPQKAGGDLGEPAGMTDNDLTALRATLSNKQ